MNMYNMLNGLCPATIFLIPMLGDKHPDQYPRFRDCFSWDENRPDLEKGIFVFTRVGGGNRDQGYGEEWLEKHPEFVETYDEEGDNTYGMYVFKVPSKWKDDYCLVEEREFSDVSDEYKKQVEKVYPKLIGKLPWSSR